MFVLCERLYVEQVEFPHIHHVIHSIWIAGETLLHRSVKRVRILRLQQGSDVRFVLFGPAAARFSKVKEVGSQAGS
jgi:hypothetical protein